VIKNTKIITPLFKLRFDRMRDRFDRVRELEMIKGLLAFKKNGYGYKKYR